MSYVTTSGKGLPLLRVYVQPKASRTGFSGMHDDMLKLTITAPPVDGKANKAVIGFLAKFFHIPKKEVTIVSGEKSRRKICCLGRLNEEEIRKRLKGKLHNL